MKRLRRFISHWQNIFGLLLVLFFVLTALSAPLLSPMDETNPGPFKRSDLFRVTVREPKPPAEAPPLGTMPGQLEVFHSLVWGTRDALSFGVTVALVAAIFGVFYGATAGYLGGVVNSTMMRIADAFLTFPVIAGVVLINQLWLTTVTSRGGLFWQGQFIEEPTGGLTPIQWLVLNMDPLALTLVLFSWMPYARLVNIIVTTLVRADFIQSSRALGASSWRIIFRHLVPNSMAPAVVLAARDIGGLVMLQATFTFIGIGGNSVWGEMLAIGRNWVIGPGGGIWTYWWVFLPATLALTFFGIGWNLLGDGLNELLDPHSR